MVCPPIKNSGFAYVGNIVSDLTGQRFEPPTFRSGDERVIARPIMVKVYYPGTAW